MRRGWHSDAVYVSTTTSVSTITSIRQKRGLCAHPLPSIGRAQPQWNETVHTQRSPDLFHRGAAPTRGALRGHVTVARRDDRWVAMPARWPIHGGITSIVLLGRDACPRGMSRLDTFHRAAAATVTTHHPRIGDSAALKRRASPFPALARLSRRSRKGQRQRGRTPQPLQIATLSVANDRNTSK